VPAALIAWGTSLTNTQSLAGTALSTWTGTAPCGTPAWAGITCAGTPAAPTVIALRSLSLSGTLSCFQGNLATLLSIDVSINSLTGSIPGCLASSLTVLTLLNLGQNRLTGTLPPELPPTTNKLLLSVYDNALVGTVPANYSKFTSIAIAYNSGLYGPLPPGILASDLVGWTSGSAFAACASSTTGCLLGTSIGLDRDLVSILADIGPALDPSGAVLGSWSNSSLRQPCPPYTGQRTTQLGYGRWLPGLFKPSSYGAATGTSYCADSGATPAAPFVFIAATTMDTLANPATSGTLGVNSALVGGISCLCASGLRLRGTLPMQLRELRTTTVILLSRNALTGSLPAAWGQNVTWNSSATPTPGFDSAVLLDLSQNALNSTLPASVGSLGSTLGLGLFDNAFVGTVPPAYTALKWLSLAYNPGLVGALPAGFTGLELFAWSAYYSGYYSWCDCSLAARGCAALTRPCGQDLYLHKWRGSHVRRAAQLWHQRRLRHGVPLRHGTRYGYRGTLALCLPRFASASPSALTVL
jgi:hypothetical protein